MEKAKEIELLQSLKVDTYFAQLFGNEQIDAMCENIRNDFPIEYGLNLFRGSDVAKENTKLKAALASRWEKEFAVAKELLVKASNSPYVEDSLEDMAERLIGHNACLIVKLRSALLLSEDDREELAKILEQ